MINAWFWISYVVLWLLLLIAVFLLMGTLRSLSLLEFRLKQVEATRPSRINRYGLRRGAKAPDFTLPSVAGGTVSLQEFLGRRVLLVFVQPSCGPCNAVAPTLNRLVTEGEYQVVAISTGDFKAVQEWANKVGAKFPVLVQEKLSVSLRYQVLATPFAFLINEEMHIQSRGAIENDRHIRFVLARPASYLNEEEESPVLQTSG
jgi:methylamine dehydrogenase accessory protein MauD